VLFSLLSLVSLILSTQHLFGVFDICHGLFYPQLSNSVMVMLMFRSWKVRSRSRDCRQIHFCTTLRRLSYCRRFPQCWPSCLVSSSNCTKSKYVLDDHSANAFRNSCDMLAFVFWHILALISLFDVAFLTTIIWGIFYYNMSASS